MLLLALSLVGCSSDGMTAQASTGSSAAMTTQMPLTAPGSLTPEQYADIMTFMLSHDCVKASPGNKPFPVSDDPAFKKVVVGGAVVPGEAGFARVNAASRQACGAGRGQTT